MDRHYNQSYWQQAWDEAEPKLQAWKDSWIHMPIGSRILRVNQLDAELLDEELVQTLKGPLARSLESLNNALRTRFDPELVLVIRLILYKFSLWNTGTTYGAKLQDLHYQVKNTDGRSLTPSGLPKRTLAIHALLTIVVPYFHTRLRSHALSKAWPDTPSSDRRRKAWNLLGTLESLHSVSALIGFISFLWNGKYRTLSDRLLSMRLVSSRRLVNRQVSYEFMNRQMVWHAFTEFLLLFLPLFGTRAFRRLVKQLSSRLTAIRSGLLSSSVSSDSISSKGPYYGLPADQCAICAENASFNISLLTNEMHTFNVQSGSSRTADSDSLDAENEDSYLVSTIPRYPITTPYSASCGHVYCYYCISERLIQATDDGEDGWECLRCKESVQRCDRVDALDGSVGMSAEWDSEDDAVLSLSSDMSIDSGPERP